MRWVAMAFLFLAPAAIAQSNRRDIRLGDYNQPQSGYREQSKNDAYGQIKNGTPFFPFIIQIEPGQFGEFQRYYEQYDHNKNADKERDWLSSDWFVAYGTIALAVFTLGLAIYTGLLYRTTKKAVIDGEAAIRAATDASVAANRYASEAARSATAMEQLAAATAASATAVAKSAQVAEDGLRVLERPHVFISFIQTNIDEAITETRYTPNKPNAKITLHNYGRSPAIIEQIGLELKLSDGLDKVAYLPSSVILGPGSPHTEDRIYQGSFSGGMARQVRAGQFDFILLFSIRYRDIFNAPHEISGTWKYHRNPSGFRPESGPYYETNT